MGGMNIIINNEVFIKLTNNDLTIKGGIAVPNCCYLCHTERQTQRRENFCHSWWRSNGTNISWSEPLWQAVMPEPAISELETVVLSQDLLLGDFGAQIVMSHNNVLQNYNGVGDLGL